MNLTCRTARGEVKRFECAQNSLLRSRTCRTTARGLCNGDRGDEMGWRHTVPGIRTTQSGLARGNKILCYVRFGGVFRIRNAGELILGVFHKISSNRCPIRVNSSVCEKLNCRCKRTTGRFRREEWRVRLLHWTSALYLNSNRAARLGGVGKWMKNYANW